MGPTIELRTPEGIRAACARLDEHPPEHRADADKQLAAFIQWVESADVKTRATLEFHKKLWEDNPISGVGMGTIPTHEIIEKADFRTWLATRSLEPLPQARGSRIDALKDFYQQIISRFSGKGRRIPHLKIFRALAAFFPDDFTTLAHRGAIERLARRMRGTAGETHVALHRYVRERLDEVIGPPAKNVEDRARRMALPWYLYALTSQESSEEEKVAITGGKSGEELLVPLPAARRRRGLTSLGGGFPTVLEILQEVKDGIPRDEFLDYLRVRYPTLKEQSRRMVINVLRSELGVLKNVNDMYSLTERGAAVLETSSAAELADWLLTRVLGIDHVLKTLEKAPQRRDKLIALLQKVNPGWTTDFAPNAMINWLVGMKVVRRDKSGEMMLEPLGEDWLEKVHWTPEFLEIQPDADEDDDIGKHQAPTALQLPTLSKVVKSLSSAGIFPPRQLEQLHLGLWSSKRRHFAVLAGISGSGKTLLARKYAEALGTTSGDGPKRHHIQAVQPGWYDPSPLLGYLNPLQKDTYQRTDCLLFLLRASQDPTRPYVLILDEMNLSHPEQYFAPLLSAMESEDRIVLHSEGDGFDGIPQSIPYPTNLAIIGTVNMDETTHGLSDKVLDRAFTMEFWDIELANYPRWSGSNLAAEEMAQLRSLLNDLMNALKPARLHFGWRTVDDVLDFLETARREQCTTSFGELLDSVMYAKVLPKLRGDDSPRMRQAFDAAKSVLETAGLTRCSGRVAALREEMARAGATRFWR